LSGQGALRQVVPVAVLHFTLAIRAFFEIFGVFK